LLMNFKQEILIDTFITQNTKGIWYIKHRRKLNKLEFNDGYITIAMSYPSI